MKKFLITTAALAALSAPTYATTLNPATISICSTENDDGCNVFGAAPINIGVPGWIDHIADYHIFVFTNNVDGTAFERFSDADGGGYRAFNTNELDITILDSAFTTMTFEIQMRRQGGSPGDGQLDTFQIRPGFLGKTIVDQSESVNPDSIYQFTVSAQGGVLDELNLVADDPPLSGGFLEIRHLRVSGLETFSVPEPSTWTMGLISLGLMTAFGLRRSRYGRS